MKERFSALADLNGGVETLQRARDVLSGAGPGVQSALREMEQISGLLKQRLPDLPVHYDLAELRGYAYQTGLVFAAFVPGYGQEIARGGRYDDIGSIFGRARPATGFSADLKTLIQLSSNSSDEIPDGIFAPAIDDEALQDRIRELRQQGERVVVELPGQQGGAVEAGCERILKQVEGSWQVVAVL